MLVNDIITERRRNPDLNIKVPLGQQIQQIIQRNGGTIDDYWVSSTPGDKLGFHGGDNTSARPEATRPGRAPVVPTGALQGQRGFRSAEFATYAVPLDQQPKNTQTKYGIWFMPLKGVQQQLVTGMYPYLKNFLFLVKLNDDAWLQPVNTLQNIRASLVGINPPRGKHKVGQYNPSSDIAVFFEPAYKVVGKWTKAEIKNSVRRDQIGGIQAQQRVGQERAAEKARLRAQQEKEIDNLF
jgi:hypothetical protein